MDLRLTAALLVGKTISFLTKLSGSGSTAAPGLYALKIDPKLIKKLSSKIKNGNIIISGTNGKTTTARLSSTLLETKYKIIHNRQGSNLLRGLASTLIANTSPFGSTQADIGLWEVDEATLPSAVENLKPKTIVLLNLFRDQLDRYGEVNTTRTRWKNIISTLDKKTTLILNADDPQIAYLSEGYKGRVVFFGVDVKKLDLPQIVNVADISYCLKCGNKLNYATVLSSHMGIYSCTKCSFKRPRVSISAQNLKFNSDFTTGAQIKVNNSPLSIKYSLPGLFNAYNMLASVALSAQMDIPADQIGRKIASFKSAFGRYQNIQIGEKKLTIFLIKNPAGANEVLRTISTKPNLSLLAILNDKLADGKDVSWIWDTNWEIIGQKVKNLAISGTRCWDLATRLKYAQFKLSNKNVYEDINYSIEKSLDNLSTNDTLIILPTYTAMLEVQNYLSKRGGTTWHKQ